MTGINQGVVFNVCRIKGIFSDKIGNEKRFSGTGFWVQESGSNYFVTNKNNLDPTVSFGDSTKLNLFELEIELRNTINGQPIRKTKMFGLADLTQIKVHDSADVAIIKDPQFTEDTGTYQAAGNFRKSDLADAIFFKNHCNVMDVASFIGYPGTSKSQWWDTDWNLGIARTVNIASLPQIPFSHSDVSTSEVCLVSGLSFSGSSGSVVLLHEKGVKPGHGLENPSYSGPKIIGIMSGHWPLPDTTPDMFNHSGLSYFTRSIAILELLENA